jgi:hypothetical protein
MSKKLMPEPGFTVAETKAFDRGVKDGEKLRHCPYDLLKNPDLWDAWQNGASVGRCNLRVTLKP